jgi:hypothetical protein
MVKLQAENLKLHTARNYFDILLEKNPTFGKYLKADADVILDPHFTNAVIKIQSKQEINLTDDEKKSVESLLKDQENRRSSVSSSSSWGLLDDDDDLSLDSNHDASEEDWLERINAAEKQEATVSAYINLDFIVPTSNCVERLFSQAKNVFRDNRQSLLPYNLEAIMFLKANRWLWDVNVVCDALTEAKNANEVYSDDDSDDD